MKLNKSINTIGYLSILVLFVHVFLYTQAETYTMSKDSFEDYFQNIIYLFYFGLPSLFIILTTLSFKAGKYLLGLFLILVQFGLIAVGGPGIFFIMGLEGVIVYLISLLAIPLLFASIFTVVTAENVQYSGLAQKLLFSTLIILIGLIGFNIYKKNNPWFDLCTAEKNQRQSNYCFLKLAENESSMSLCSFITDPNALYAAHSPARKCITTFLSQQGVFNEKTACDKILNNADTRDVCLYLQATYLDNHEPCKKIEGDEWKKRCDLLPF